jgi:1,4-alpha-glucan branching enzyme
MQSSVMNENGGSPGNGSNDINSGGVAWGMTAQNGVVANATRPFPSGLTSGQSFQIDMDNGNIGSGGSVGFALQNSASISVLEFYFQGGATNYTINAGSTNGTPTPFTHAGLHTTFTLTSASTYSLSVLAYTPGGAAGAGSTYTSSGNLLSPSGGQTITSVRLFNYQAGSGTNYTVYFNNMSISGGTAADTASNAAYNTAGSTFRVWAPNASGVHVEGSWNSFSTTATPLYSEGNGNWSADVTGALNGHQYKYFITNSTAGVSVTRQDPRSRKVVSVSGYSYIYNTTNFNWSGDNFTAPGLSNAVIYELNIGSFNDPYAPGNPGTFYTATNTLPYLAQLGITAVEVMPVSQFGCCYSWGYNPALPFAVDNDAYGGPDAFKAFVKAAHQLGMAVILDTVQNHFGGSDTGSYGNMIYGLWQFDGYASATNYGGIYFYQDPCLGWAYTGPPWGPRPDYDTPQVYQYIVDNITMWLNEYHVDGFRWDSVGEIVNDWPCSDNGNWTYGSMLVTNCAAIVHSAPGGKINIGEDRNEFTGYYGFDATWNNNIFFGLVKPNLTAASDSSRNMGSISTAINENFTHYNGSLGGWGSVIFLEDHDQTRLPDDINSSAPTGYYARKRSMLGSAINLTTAGMPMLLQGEEFLTTTAFSAQNALDWSLTNTWSGIVSYYTDLIHLRRNLDGRSSGLQGLNTQTIAQDTRPNTPLIAYRRWNTGNVGDDVVIICNFANTNWPAYSISGFPHDGTWYTQVNSDWTKYCSDYGNYGSSGTITVSGGSGTFSIAPYSVLIFSQNLPGPPPTPQNLHASSVATNQIGLAWNVSSAATNYIVYRGGTNQLATTTNNVYTDSGLSVGVQYCYSVAATGLGGTSAVSSAFCTTTLPATGATNLLAYWTFDEGSGSIANDSSGNTNTGTAFFGGNGGGWTSSGMIKGAIYFDADGTQVTVSNSASINPVNGITVAAWVSDQSGGWFTNPRFVEKGKSNNQYALFAIGQSNQLEFVVAGVSNGTLIATPPSSGAWHHLAGTYDGKSLISLYIDGQLAAQQSASGAMPVTTDPLAIGNRPSGSLSYQLNGYLDDVRIYGSALPPSEIAQLYNFDSVGDGIANWWRQYYFGYSSYTDYTSCAACDVYGTGQNNYFKYVAGLNPTDSSQIFTVQIAAVASNQSMNLTFGPIVNGDNYTVLSSPDLVNYSALTSNSVPQINGSQETITDYTPWPSNEFYTIQINNPNL